MSSWCIQCFFMETYTFSRIVVNDTVNDTVSHPYKFNLLVVCYSHGFIQIFLPWKNFDWEKISHEDTVGLLLLRAINFVNFTNLLLFAKNSFIEI